MYFFYKSCFTMVKLFTGRLLFLSKGQRLRYQPDKMKVRIFQTQMFYPDSCIYIGFKLYNFYES